jgi:hypothetical protein
MACSGSATTTAMRLRPPLSERLRRRCRWLIPAALLALTPKCILCVLAYAGLGAALGTGGLEICGAPADPAGNWPWLVPALGMAAGVVALCRRA